MTLESNQRWIGKVIGAAPQINILPPKFSRPFLLLMDKLFGLPKQRLDSVSNLSIPLASTPGQNIGIRVYRPTNRISGATMVYFHGGGFVLGDLNSHDNLCRKLALECGISIVAVDYRLAPEHKYPTAIIDCIDAWNWINDNAAALKISTAKIGIGGDSAGGYLSIAVGLPSLHSTLPTTTQRKPDFQYLLYPITDARGQTESYKTHTKDLLLTSGLMSYFYESFLNTPNEAETLLASPILTANLAEAPKTYLLTVEYDPLRDEGQAMASRMKEAGVDIVHEHIDDCMHAFVHLSKISARAKEASTDLVRPLTQLIA
ncbi:alpha/beta hydrolase [Veronia nyctiphanis]|uniref:Alpha/beta hydrolase n=1 Tax=Veronia nyctiphanis TaxID=1278244 RepID=A0A4Q0YX80_9GAMM|nr:alpha/beta hydrolase [Veronia nyctiphanis]RXJ73671.1 alpha/beta hydrolase [Veronia nyctiphanis]